MQWVEGRVAAARNVARVLADYSPEHAIAQTCWISDALDIAPSTLAIALGTAYRDANRLPPPGTRAGDLLRAAANQSVAYEPALTDAEPLPSIRVPTLTD